MKWFITCLFLALGAGLISQTDSVLLKNGIRAKIEVVDITTGKVIYRLPGEHPGHLHAIRRSEIQELWLHTSLRMDDSGNYGDSVLLPGNNVLSDFKRNEIYINLMPLVFNTVSVGCQRYIGDGLFSVGAYFNTNLGAQNLNVTYYGGKIVPYYDVQFAPRYRQFTAGLNLRYFPFKQRRYTWYLFNNLQAGNFLFQYQEYYYVPYPPVVRSSGNTLGFCFGTGLLMRVTPFFIADVGVGGGISRYVYPGMGDEVCPRMVCNLSLGYAF